MRGSLYTTFIDRSLKKEIEFQQYVTVPILIRWVIFLQHRYCSREMYPFANPHWTNLRLPTRQQEV